MGAELGFAVCLHEAVRVRGLEVSSSAIRALIAAGDVRRARWMLGRPFAVLSTPASGRGIGTRLLGAHSQSRALRGVAPGLRRLRYAAHGERARVSGRDQRRQPPDLRRSVLLPSSRIFSTSSRLTSTKRRRSSSSSCCAYAASASGRRPRRSRLRYSRMWRGRRGTLRVRSRFNPIFPNKFSSGEIEVR